MNPEVGAQIRAELFAQQRRHSAMRAELSALCMRLFEFANDRVRGERLPTSSALEAWRDGYDHGCYRGFSEAGALIAEAMDKMQKRAAEGQ